MKFVSFVVSFVLCGFIFIVPFEAEPVTHLVIPKAQICSRKPCEQASVTVETPAFALRTNKPVRFKWVLHAAQGSCIQFTVKRFAAFSTDNDSNIEGCFSDYLAIFDGSTSSSPLLLRTCGASVTSPVIRSTGNTMHIAFYSESPDKSPRVPNQGFVGHAIDIKCPDVDAIDWSGIEPIILEIPAVPKLGDNSGRHLLKQPPPPQITIITPQFAPSAKDVRLKWVIGVAEGACVKFTLKRLAIEYQPACYNSFLEVFDGPNQNSPLLWRVCGVTSESQSVLSTKNRMYLAFYGASPGDSTRIGKQGFFGFATAATCPAVTVTQTTPSKPVEVSTTTPTIDYDVGPSAPPLIPLASVDNIKGVNFGDQIVCGYPFFKPHESDNLGRIVGGDVAEPNSWPWQASLRYHNQHTCGGSLISRRHVITASHCFAPSTDPKQYTIYLGKNTRDQGERSEQRLDVESIKRHPDYGIKGKYDSDIAILTLKEPGATINTYVNPICLPRRAPPSGYYCYSTGYGKTLGTGGDGMLKQAAIPIISNEKCQTMNPKIPQLLSDNMICAGYKDGGTDSCTGDSGGPLTCKLGTFPHLWTLNGLVSFGFACAEANSPGIYTRVGKFVPWILENVNDLPPQY